MLKCRLDFQLARGEHHVVSLLLLTTESPAGAGGVQVYTGGEREGAGDDGW